MKIFDRNGKWSSAALKIVSRLVVFIVLITGQKANSYAVTWDQTISREHPVFQVAEAKMAIGRDGRVYLSSMDKTGMSNPGYVLRLSREGRETFGGHAGPATTSVTANAQGIIAAANAHFNHKITLYDKNLVSRNQVSDFSAGTRYMAPARVEAGISGDFYGLDQYADRIVRLNPSGQVVKTYAYTREPAGDKGEVNDFRVDEKNTAFYLQTGTYEPIRKIGFDGKTQWSTEKAATGGFDVDANGILYLIEATGDKIHRIAPDGQALGETNLQWGNLRANLNAYPIRYLRVWQDEVLLKRSHPQELFLRFDLRSGELKQTIPARFERLTATFPSETWVAGDSVPFNIEFQDSIYHAKPRWRVWGRTLGAVDYREFPLANGKLQVPIQAGGIYQIKVTPEVIPWQHDVPSEYIVQGWVEIRQPNTRGTLNVWTPDNRSHYGRGENIPLTVLPRGGPALDGKQLRVSLQLVENSNEKGQVLAKSSVLLTAGQHTSFTLPSSMTRALRVGAYRVEAVTEGLTTVSQPLYIGSGLAKDDFHRILYGDYEALWPNTSNLWDAPDLAAASALRTQKRGINLLIERLNSVVPGNPLIPDASLIERLKKDPLAVAPEKAQMSHVFLQTLAAHGARGTRQMSILLGNDQGLPMGADFGGPPPTSEAREKFKATQAESITRLTRMMRPYPSFRGWSWAANWWLTDSAKQPQTPEAKAAYQAATKRALETGRWEPLIDQIANTNLSYAPTATAWFNEVLRKESSTLKTAVAAPYRNGQAYPPISFSNVDEVDLQAQWEQIAPPAYAPHNVDFYERPGKPSLAHPEVWNDSGTGEQILPTLFNMFMRGADGLGYANHLYNWDFEDSRSSQAGGTSVVRALNGVLRQYGSWTSGLGKSDRIAIIVSGRMIKLDEWKLTTHRAIFEAYLSCLHIQHPASIVFSEDLKPDSLKKFKAVLIVGQKVEMEPQLKSALKNAQVSGVRIFRDNACREELVREFTPLGISFDKLSHEMGLDVGGDESAYPRVLQTVRSNLPALRKALDKVVTPIARIQNDEVWITERTSGAARFLFVVNNTQPELEPEHLWRMNLYSGSLMPVQAELKLSTTAPAIYDVFALKRVLPQNGTLNADLRSLPARLYAMLPTPIESVALRGPTSVTHGAAFQWWAQLRDAKGAPINAELPIRLRLLTTKRQVLDEQFLSSGLKGAYGQFTMPLNVPAGVYQLEATDLISGKSTRISIRLAAANQPIAFTTPNLAAKPIAANISGNKVPVSTEPVTDQFGLRLRDMVLTSDGRVAVMNAMNWGDNVFAIDTLTGKSLWQKQVGQYYAFAPQTHSAGFTIQGFDFETPEGYQLYVGDTAGNLKRRFSLYGIPQRLPFRMYASGLHDRINNFAASPKGDWFANAGSLGIAVWNEQGGLLWSQDDWKESRSESRYNVSSTWENTRQSAPAMIALDATTLLLADEEQVSARDARTGGEKWKVELPAKGQILRLRVALGGKQLAVLSEAESGQITSILDGKIQYTIPARDTYDFELADDASALAVLTKNQLKVHDKNGGLLWSFSGDDRLRFARFSLTGNKIAVTSDLGTLTVLDSNGRQLHERDLKAVAVPCWLPDGGLLLATWMGDVHRLNVKFETLWKRQLQSRNPSKRPVLLAKNQTPTSSMTGWSNAEAKSFPLTPNLLTSGKAYIRFPNVERVVQNEMALLTDGKPDAPAKPWMFPGEVNQWAGLRFHNSLSFEFKTPVRATALTFVEDAAHPASWLRDADLEYWDESSKQWVFLQSILANSAIHTHRFVKPVETTKVRVVLPFGLYGNLRFGELVLHGEVLSQ